MRDGGLRAQPRHVNSGEWQLRRAILVSNGDLIPRPLRLRVTLAVSTPSYLSRLAREADLVARLFDRDREVAALAFDCNPSEAASDSVLNDLLLALHAQFHLAPGLMDAARARCPGPGADEIDPDHDLIGLGVGAVSTIGGVTFRNLEDLSAWQRAIDAGQLPVGFCDPSDVTSHRVAVRHPTTRAHRR